jgi:predicted RNase H-like HicB family nuclease
MKLSIRIVQNEQGQYTARCPMLPGCMCHGDTPKQAEERLDEAIRGYIAAMSNFVPEHLDREVVLS